MMELAAHVTTHRYDVWNYYQSTAKARAHILQNLILPVQKYVQLQGYQDDAECPTLPAWESAVRALTAKVGCRDSNLTTSSPVYPLAPITAVLTFSGGAAVCVTQLASVVGQRST